MLATHAPTGLETLLTEFDPDVVSVTLAGFDDDELEVTIQLTDNAALVNRLARIERGRRSEAYERKVLPGSTFSQAEKNARSEERKVAAWFDSHDQPIQEVADNGWKKLVARARGNGSRPDGDPTISNEWYTPAKYVEAARSVLGGFDLDPASSVEANQTVRAEAIFTEEDDGLSRDWYGTVWLNPPYGGGSGKFAGKLVDEFQSGRVEAAILLVNANSTDTAWFGPLWDYTLCFTDHRIDFDVPSGIEKTSSSSHGSVFVYLGPEPLGFREEFVRFGNVVRRWP